MALEGLFRHPDGARALGRRYLEQHPEDADVDRLLNLLFKGAPPPGVARLRAHIRAASGRDFAAGRTVCIDGWILSPTECRTCALVALTGPRAV